MKAKVLRNWEPHVICDIIQTAGYADSIFEEEAANLYGTRPRCNVSSGYGTPVPMTGRVSGTVIGLSYEASYQSGTWAAGLWQLPTACVPSPTTVCAR